MIGFASVLGLAAVASAMMAYALRGRVRIYLGFACVLYGALAAAAWFAIAPDAVGLIVTTLALALLMLAALERAPKPAVGASALALACLAGIGAAFTGELLPAVIVQLFCAGVLLATAYRRFKARAGLGVRLALAVAALLGATCSLPLAGGHVAMLLFSAAGLLGVALSLTRASQAFVEDREGANRRPAIGRLRPWR